MLCRHYNSTLKLCAALKKAVNQIKSKINSLWYICGKSRNLCVDLLINGSPGLLFLLHCQQLHQRFDGHPLQTGREESTTLIQKYPNTGMSQQSAAQWLRSPALWLKCSRRLTGVRDKASVCLSRISSSEIYRFSRLDWMSQQGVMQALLTWYHWHSDWLITVEAECNQQHF